jgi:hypothetical protein
VLVNRSTRGATDDVFWPSTPASADWGATLLPPPTTVDRTAACCHFAERRLVAVAFQHFAELLVFLESIGCSAFD